MTAPAQAHHLPITIRRLLDRLRRQIRWYVWTEGLALAIAWLGLVFWLGFALDYLPVRIGSQEMPRAARAVLLSLMAAGLAFVLYRYVLRRVFARLSDTSLALLLERAYPEFNDALITAVNTPPGGARSALDPTAPREAEAEAALHDAMLTRAVAIAAQRAEHAESKRVFNFGPLWRSVLLAVAAIGSIAAFAAWKPPMFATWTSRMLLLSDAGWPRRALIEVLEFPDGQRKVAQGADMIIRVRAATVAPRIAPKTCTIDYVTEDGDRGRVTMSRDGEPRNGFQYYRYEGQPFQGMLAPVTFDVFGYDHRASGYHVNVVPSPSISRVLMSWQEPAYLQQPQRSPQPWQPGVSVPAGSQVMLEPESTKPLRQAAIDTVESSETQTVVFDQEPAPQRFELPLGEVRETTTRELSLLDTDNVTSEQPYRITILVREDLEPTVDLRLQGIGTAITPDARIPVVGKVTDDYQVKEAWFQVDIPEQSATLRMDLPRAPAGDVDSALDLRRQRAERGDDWRLEPGAKILFRVRASDFYDLESEPHIGQGEEVPLDVVKPDELLALLEARELGLKRRFEQTLTELEETRDSLLRLQAMLDRAPTTDGGTSPGSDADERPGQTDADGESASGSSEDPSSVQQSTLRRLRVQRAQQQAAKSQQEVDGVAGAFADIRAELINNRVDTPQRNERLQDQIVTPLRLIVADQFPRWVDQLASLEQQLDDSSQALPMAREAVRQNNELILALQEVLEKMIELETYNELVDLVRSIIAEQESIQSATEEAGKKEARSLLED